MMNCQDNQWIAMMQARHFKTDGKGYFELRRSAGVPCPPPEAFSSKFSTGKNRSLSGRVWANSGTDSCLE